jgi:radical SAM superfamily enzyme YgiQ (UPF0313 family)
MINKGKSLKKIILIAPLPKANSRTPSPLRIPQITLYYLAALTPGDRYEIKTIDEEYTDINLDEPCDMVGISIMTSNSTRGYYLADEFRKRGRKVVLGGIHATVLPDEALQHADAVCVGEAETIWHRMLDDFEHGKLQGKYTGEYPQLDNPAIAPQPALHLAPRNMWDVKGLVTTRGCPYHCSFCCVHKFYGPKIRHVPPKMIAQTMDQYDTKYWMFMDDNILGNPQKAEALFDEIAPLKKTWLSQGSIAHLRNATLVKKMAQSGCGGIFFGVENVTQTGRGHFAKNKKHMPYLEDTIKRFQDLGMIFHASLIFGLDNDTIDTFKETLEFLMRNKIVSVTFNLLTPYPGTQLYEEFNREGRIITDDWTKYDHSSVVFRPAHFTPAELMEHYLTIRKEFYSYGSIAKRIWTSPHPIFSLLMNIAYRSGIKNQLRDFHSGLSQIKFTHPEAPNL